MRTLLAIETSCDETAAAVVDEDGTVRSSIVASQTELHASYGGVVPELASRAHIELISWVVGQALDEGAVTGVDLEAVAVTSVLRVVPCLPPYCSPFQPFLTCFRPRMRLSSLPFWVFVTSLLLGSLFCSGFLRLVYHGLMLPALLLVVMLVA